MKYIVPIAVIAILALQFSGAVPQSSVGGPMTLALVFFAAALAVGIHEAWTSSRGVLGWILSIILAFVGSFIGAEVGNLVLEPILMQMNIGGSLAQTRHPMLYVSSVAMMLFGLVGAWVALKAVSRWR